MAITVNINSDPSKQDYLGTDVNDAIDNANAPNATNPFATLDDLTGGLPTGAIPSGYVSRVTPLVISSPTFIDVPDLSTTLEVTASVRGYCLFSFETSSTGSDAFMEFKVIINGEDSDTVLVDFAKDANANGSINFRTSSNLAIGSHIVKVQARKVSGSKIPSLDKGFLFTFALQAPKGDTGAGVPVGGSANQVLSKIDGADYNTQWVTPASGGGSLDIGTSPITGGVVNRLLFEGAGNVLQEDANLTWNSTNKRLNVKALDASSNPVLNIEHWTNGSSLFKVRGDGVLLAQEAEGKPQYSFNADPLSGFGRRSVNSDMLLYDGGIPILRFSNANQRIEFFEASGSFPSLTLQGKTFLRVLTSTAFELGNGWGRVFMSNANLEDVKYLQVAGKINAPNLPTSTAGLSAGDIWNDAGTLKIV